MSGENKMLELLPLFLAVAGILIIGLGAALAALVKMPLLRFCAGGSPRVRWTTVVQVVVAEVLILGCSVLAILQRMSSEVTAFHGYGLWFMGALFCGSTILYCAFGVIPNLYLIGKATTEVKSSRKDFQRLGYAALLALPTPLFSFTLAIILYASTG
jgi:hypothetical protein